MTNHYQIKTKKEDMLDEESTWWTMLKHIEQAKAEIRLPVNFRLLFHMETHTYAADALCEVRPRRTQCGMKCAAVCFTWEHASLLHPKSGEAAKQDPVTEHLSSPFELI